MKRVFCGNWFLVAALLVVLPWFSPVQAQYPDHVCAQNLGCEHECPVTKCNPGYECVQNYTCPGDILCSDPNVITCDPLYNPTCIYVSGCPVGCHPSVCYETTTPTCVSDLNPTGLANYDDCTPDTWVCGGCLYGPGPIPTGTPPTTPTPGDSPVCENWASIYINGCSQAEYNATPRDPDCVTDARTVTLHLNSSNATHMGFANLANISAAGIFLDGEGGYPGVATYGQDYNFDSSWLTHGQTWVSSKNWLVHDTASG